MATAAYMRRYTIRMLAFGLAYAVALVGAIGIMKQPWAPTAAAAYLLAVLPALPVIGMIWTIMRLAVETEDEYQRHLFGRQVLVATGLTLSLATIWGFLENFHLAAEVPGYHVTLVWFVMFGIAGCFVRWRA